MRPRVVGTKRKKIRIGYTVRGHRTKKQKKRKKNDHDPQTCIIILTYQTFKAIILIVLKYYSVLIFRVSGVQRNIDTPKYLNFFWTFARITNERLLHEVLVRNETMFYFHRDYVQPKCFSVRSVLQLHIIFIPYYIYTYKYRVAWL